MNRRSCGHSFVLAATCETCAQYAADNRERREAFEDVPCGDGITRYAKALRPYRMCDGMDGSLPCSKPYGHDGPHYFFNP